METINPTFMAGRQLAPKLMLDQAEPFTPEVLVATVCQAQQDSLTFPGVRLSAPEDGVCVEYAIWWDGDIREMYGLEHAWVRAERHGDDWRVLTVHVSHEGGIRQLDSWDESDGRVVLYCEPGVHDMASRPSDMPHPLDITDWRCGPGAGLGGMRDPGHEQVRFTPRANDHRRAAHQLRAKAFNPLWRFTREIDTRSLLWLDWKRLAREAPARLRRRLERSHDAPLYLRAGPWLPEDSEFVHIRSVGSDGQLDGLPLNAGIAQLRGARRQALLDLPVDADQPLLLLLAETAWQQHMIAALLVSCQPKQERIVRQAGLTPAPWWSRTEEPPTGGWVRVDSEQDARAARPYALVAGPLFADLLVPPT